MVRIGQLTDTAEHPIHRVLSNAAAFCRLRSTQVKIVAKVPEADGDTGSLGRDLPLCIKPDQKTRNFYAYQDCERRGSASHINAGIRQTRCRCPENSFEGTQTTNGRY